MKNIQSPGLAHIVTIGTSPTASAANVVEALATDLKAARPARVVILSTKDSEDNARTLLKGIGIASNLGHVRLLDSAQSLDDAYAATNEEIERLAQQGFPTSRIILHYTAGTKVMSAGAVLAAVSNEVLSLRYLYSPGQRRPSIPVTTEPRLMLLDGKLRLCRTLFEELRFTAARDILTEAECKTLPEGRQETVTNLAHLASFLDDWDNFRASASIERWRTLEGKISSIPEDFEHFLPSSQHIAAIRSIADASRHDASYPDELLFDLVNNAIRRLAERRPDDAMIRLHRAAELYAQKVLQENWNIRTDDVDIRKVPPRFRTSFEAERRLDDATIKLGLRKSYDLLAVLGDPVGSAWEQSVDMRNSLSERRNLVLAHGKRPASATQAINFFEALVQLLEVNSPKVKPRLQKLQFSWIENEKVLKALRSKPESDISIISTHGPRNKNAKTKRRGSRSTPRRTSSK